MYKHIVLSLSLLLLFTSVCTAQSRIDCDFQQRSYGLYSKVKPTRCEYLKGWDGMQRASWNLVNVSRDGKVKDRSDEIPKGYFAYFESRKRPIGHVSRFTSPIVTLRKESCVSFYYVNKGIKRAFPEGRSKLQVFFQSNQLPEREVQLWENTDRTSRSKWKKVEIRLPMLAKKNIRGKLVFAALRGKSQKSYIAIDDVTLFDCGVKSVDSEKVKYIMEVPAKRLNPIEPIRGSEPNPNDIWRILPARRRVETSVFSLPPGSIVNPATIVLPSTPDHVHRRHKSRSRGNRRNRDRGQKKKKEYNIVYYTEEPTKPLASTNEAEVFIPSLTPQSRPEVICDFIEYTHGVKRCLRSFFSMLKQHKSRRKCNDLYTTLESCLQEVATRCVPSNDMTKEEVVALVSDTLRNKFKTQEVYCQEEGAFVFPEFSLGSLPLQCNQEYFMKLTMCGGAFSGIFNIKHGDPKLCSEYFTANECQRRTTADECNFDTRTMLVYGLNLQYQFAHNPFCIDLPFSAWWPHA